MRSLHQLSLSLLAKPSFQRGFTLTENLVALMSDTSDPDATCSTAPNDLVREILVKIEVNNEPVYDVQTAFTLL
jgi:hypothetical protein